MGGKSITRMSKKWNGAFLALGILSTGTILILASFIPLIYTLKKELNAELLLITKSKTLVVEAYFERLKGIAKSVTYQTQNSDKIKIKSSLVNILSQFPEVAGISRFDTTGKRLLSEGLPVPSSWLLQQKPSLKTLQILGKINLDGTNYLGVSVPLESPNQQPVGTNIVLFKLSDLEKIINQDLKPNLPEKTIIGKIYPQGIEILSFQTSKFSQQIGLQTPLGMAFQKSAAQGHGLLFLSINNAPDQLIAYHQVSDSSWHLITEISTSVLLIPIYQQLAFSAGSLLILFWLSIGVIIFWRIRITHSSIQPLTLDTYSPAFNPTIEPILSLQISDVPARSALPDSSIWERNLAANTSDAFWDWNLITNEVYFSPQWKQWVSQEELEISPHIDEWFKRIYPEDLERVRAEITVYLAGHSSYFKNEHRLLYQDGHYRWILTQAVMIRNAAGEAIRMAGVMIDITEYKHLQEEAIHLAAFPKYNPNPVLAYNHLGHLIYLNPATQKLLTQLGYQQAEDLLPTNHIQILKSCLAQNKQNDCIEVQLQHRIFTWSYTPIEDFNIVHLCGIEITHQQQAEEKLLQAAWHDSLTGLPNRTLFLRCLEQIVTRAKQGEQDLFAILFLDLDRFKVVNDSLGHLLGDKFLVKIAHRLTACLDQNNNFDLSEIPYSKPLNSAQLSCQKNLVARLGGDEFIILLGKIKDISEVIEVAETIQKELSLPIYLDNHEVFTSVSIGISIAAYRQQPGQVEFNGYPYENPEDLLRDADIAMYRAKALGKARYVVFDGTMHQRTLELLQLENDLRRALHTEPLKAITPEQESSTWNVSDSMFIEFLLYYQPIVALDTGRIAGFEALVRWQHPERGLVSPVEFIPVAEETGLIVPLGRWVLHQACWQLRKWQAQFPNHHGLTMTVNLSGKQLSQSDLLEQIDQTLQQTGINPLNLKLEITESVLMDNAAVAIAVLEQLRARNIGLCIDDFGTGYSSLSYLHRFPINTLKIDRSFVSEMSGDDENSEIVRAIVTLAHNLGMYVVAEGVETEKQLVQLWALQCEYGQGYFFAKPLTVFDAEALMAKEPQW